MLKLTISALVLGMASALAFAQLSVNGPAGQNFGAGSNPQTGGNNYPMQPAPAIQR